MCASNLFLGIQVCILHLLLTAFVVQKDEQRINCHTFYLLYVLHHK